MHTLEQRCVGLTLQVPRPFCKIRGYSRQCGYHCSLGISSMASFGQDCSCKCRVGMFQDDLDANRYAQDDTTDERSERRLETAQGEGKREGCWMSMVRCFSHRCCYLCRSLYVISQLPADAHFADGKTLGSGHTTIFRQPYLLLIPLFKGFWYAAFPS